MTEANDITFDHIGTIQMCLDTIRRLIFNIEAELEAMRELEKEKLK